MKAVSDSRGTLRRGQGQQALAHRRGTGSLVCLIRTVHGMLAASLPQRYHGEKRHREKNGRRGEGVEVGLEITYQG